MNGGGYFGRVNEPGRVYELGYGGMASAYPRIPGHEVVGTVEKTGSESCPVKVDQRVGIGWHGGHGTVTGLTQDGGYAQYMCAFADSVVTIPEILEDIVEEGSVASALLLLLLLVVPMPLAAFYVALALAEVVFGIAYGLTSSLYSMRDTLSEYQKGVDAKGMAMAGSSLAIKIAVAALVKAGGTWQGKVAM